MSDSRTALVFGASGFIGRWLVRELLARGVAVVAAVRSERSYAQLSLWLAAHGTGQQVDHVLVDFDDARLGLDPADRSIGGVTEVYNVAGAYRFGMTINQARAANVTSSERIVIFASQLPSLTRLVHLSGYRVGGQDPAQVPWSSARVEAEYARLGAYEASKVESDAVVQATASKLGVPWTIVNPATVIGDSVTGESEQLLGIAGTIRELRSGNLAALPGGDDTFVPVVTVDYLAAFMALLPTVPSTRSQSFWPLDDATPPLPTMLTMLAKHLDVRAPRFRIPVRLLRALPPGITKAHPETLSFLSSDRYPTSSANDLAESHGLHHPDVTVSLKRWADYLVAHRFGIIPPSAAVRTFTSHAGVRTFSIGKSDAHTIVLPGLPVSAETWAETAQLVGGWVLDLPGLGSSAGSSRDWHAWLESVIGDSRNVHLVGHSVGAALALEYAADHPDIVARLTLISPHFLQTRAALTQRLVPLAWAYFKSVTAVRLAEVLTGNQDQAEKLQSSVADLRRGSARATAQLLRGAAQPKRRRNLARLLAQYPGDVQLIVGSDDPLLVDAESVAAVSRDGRPIPVHIIHSAGHHPQLTHAATVARLIHAEARDAGRPPAPPAHADL
ncbi:alpha/beta fold hydrolase [Cryobacterium sp. TMT3-29-2]|uniref:alpha/beta fold hydrolase n=1 Tax=Cryobacterium sp. TMT3-29-2 TaxID=2555867 RepID=UPI0010744E96|nr:alpha/beta fold hydrolase [Cryobacterium sp. TMT3-29-2]TFC89926.1 alpha/beta fold hydrolase [Cryobacterium sp. TMT3-29-2]